jgi:hypothetical protein
MLGLSLNRNRSAGAADLAGMINEIYNDKGRPVEVKFPATSVPKAFTPFSEFVREEEEEIDQNGIIYEVLI